MLPPIARSARTAAHLVEPRFDTVLPLLVEVRVGHLVVVLHHLHGRAGHHGHTDDLALPWPMDTSKRSDAAAAESNSQARVLQSDRAIAHASGGGAGTTLTLHRQERPPTPERPDHTNSEAISICS
jgi:hypothetical protein